MWLPHIVCYVCLETLLYRVCSILTWVESSNTTIDSLNGFFYSEPSNVLLSLNGRLLGTLFWIMYYFLYEPCSFARCYWSILQIGIHRGSCFSFLRVSSCSWDPPRRRFPCLRRLWLVCSSSNSLACFVMMRLIIFVWCLVGMHLCRRFICVEVFALERFSRRRGRVSFHRPFNFNTVVQLRTRLCCVYMRRTRYQSDV